MHTRNLKHTHKYTNTTSVSRALVSYSPSTLNKNQTAEWEGGLQEKEEIERDHKVCDEHGGATRNASSTMKHHTSCKMRMHMWEHTVYRLIYTCMHLRSMCVCACVTDRLGRAHTGTNRHSQHAHANTKAKACLCLFVCPIQVWDLVIHGLPVVECGHFFSFLFVKDHVYMIF